jgi:hypothetical protein
MSESKHSQVWVAIVAGVVVFAAATWFVGDEPPEEPGNTPREARQVESVAGPGTSGSPLRIEEHGRLSLDVSTLPSAGPLALVLDLPDEARGQDLHTILVVSTDGRRLETTARPLPGQGTGVQLEIESGFLTQGRYLIEVHTAEKTALPFRRYVLELN